MDAQDISPSRLARARLKILDILERRGSGQTALVVYSSNAFTVTPLTTDNDTIAALVSSLSTDIMPSRGSYPVAAINKGWQLLQQDGRRVLACGRASRQGSEERWLYAIGAWRRYQ
jgi:Ca-activated chloride channel family protein